MIFYHFCNHQALLVSRYSHLIPCDAIFRCIKIIKYKTQENLKVCIQDQVIFLCFLIMLFGDWPWPHSIREIEGYCSAGEKKTCCIQHPPPTVARDEDIFANFLLHLNLFWKLHIGKLIYFTLIWLIFTPFFQYFEL